MWSGSSNGSRYGEMNGNQVLNTVSQPGNQAENDALRAAQVHGQITTEADQRKPMRLGKLPSAKSSRKKKHKYANIYDEQM